MKRAWLLCIIICLALPFKGVGQNCVIKDLANTMTKNQLCSPVQVSWNVSYEDVNDAGTIVEIHYDWGDGSSDTIIAIEDTASTFSADATHTYISQDDVCNYNPVATLVVNGVMCTSSSQAQIVTVWDTDNKNGGKVNAEPDVYPVCVGNGATMQFDDGTLFNCVPPQENDVPNEDSRWVQFVYGTRNIMSSPVSVDDTVRSWPYEGPVFKLNGPVHGSTLQSLPITVADDNLIGEEFEVELRYWNYCNPYLPGMPEEPAEIDYSVIRIVGNPDATITPVDTMCEFNNPIVLQVATAGGTFSGNGIFNPSTGAFAPFWAGPGTHEIKYQVTDGNSCSSADSLDITVRDVPDGTITPVDPFCIYDAPYDLESLPAVGTWNGNGITNVNTGMFDPAVAGFGSHDVVFTTPVDASGCSGVDSAVVRVANLPEALFITPDSAWCEQPSNQSTADILIYGADTSLFDLVIEIRGTLDTLLSLSAGTFTLFLNNQVGRNEYVLNKIIEHHGNNSCDNDLNDTLVMEVHPKPDMTVTASYDDFCSPVDVEFSSVAGYDKYYWNFGDNDSSMVRNETISHTYTMPAGGALRWFVDSVEVDTFYYQVFQLDTIFQYQLAIESFFGCMDTITDSIHIYQTPVADFFVTPEVQSFPETGILLVNTSSFGDWSYLWDFGDAQTDVVKDPNEHVYETYGFYDIQLTTYNEYCSDNIIKTVQIIPPPPIARFEPDSIGCPPLEITFRNTSEHADTYIWNFDDDYYSTEENPTHTFYESKEHHVELIAIGLSGKDTTEQLVVIHERPNALFDVYPRSSKALKQNFKFSNTSFNAIYYLWDFGDGATSPDENPDHVYSKEGTFTVTLYAWSEYDCLDTLVRESLITVIAGEGSTKFPNAFVWNGSGPSGGYWEEGTIDNTVFHPHFVNAVKLRMIIYTRWGEKLFETNELYRGWDGYLNSEKLASPGVYVYRAWVTYIDGRQEPLTGDVTFFH